MTDERYVATRTITAPPEAVFAVLADPARHRETEPGDWVRDAVDVTPLTAAGQIFAMNMHFDRADRPETNYVTHNLVTAFEPNRTIAWATGSLTEAGRHDPGGWWWRYDLAPNGTDTDVTLTYDWSATPQAFRDQVGMPPFEVTFIEESLAALDRAVTG